MLCPSVRKTCSGLVAACLLAASSAAQPLATGDLLVGDGPSLVLVGPTTGTQTTHGIASADVRDVAVDAQWQLLALTTDGSIERFDPMAFGGDPTSNRETVGALAGASGIALDGDGTLLLADTTGNRIVRLDPNAFQPGNPTANQSTVSSGGLLDGPLDVAIDPQLDVAYCTTTTKVVRIDLAADPGSNQQQVAANPFVWASLAVLAAGRIAAAGPFGVARMDPAEPPLVTPSVVASGGELQQPTGLAVEDGGSLVVPEFSDGDVVRIFPDAFDPLDHPANQELVTHFDVAPSLHGIAVVPEPGALGLQAVALAALQRLVRRRSQKGGALV
jgi:hypothetical protein